MLSPQCTLHTVSTKVATVIPKTPILDLSVVYAHQKTILVPPPTLAESIPKTSLDKPINKNKAEIISWI